MLQTLSIDMLRNTVLPLRSGICWFSLKCWLGIQLQEATLTLGLCSFSLRLSVKNWFSWDPSRRLIQLPWSGKVARKSSESFLRLICRGAKNQQFSYFPSKSCVLSSAKTHSLYPWPIPGARVLGDGSCHLMQWNPADFGSAGKKVNSIWHSLLCCTLALEQLNY